MSAARADPSDVPWLPRETRARALALAALLFAVVLALYARTRTFEFLNYDDDVYVTRNAMVRQGLTLASARWAFTSAAAANWHPLTWLSHMLDVELFGLDPGAHHLTSVALHAVNAALLLLALCASTRALWPSAFCAAFFALHPLRVESVAWIAERKDVLAGTFWMLTWLAYERYARRGGRLRYGLVVVCFGLGLMAKPMLVTLPFVLLLLDVWPLGRWKPGGPRSPRPSLAPTSSLPSLAPTHPGMSGETRGVARGFHLVREKTPLFLLAAASALVTARVQRAGGAVGPLDAIDLAARIANALESYASYLANTLWPSGLIVFRPHPALSANASPWSLTTAAAAGLIAALSALAFAVRRRVPGVLVGWLWFLGTLVPVIGLVQVGLQAWADRYSYLPSIGLAIALVWGALPFFGAPGRRRIALAPAALAVLAACSLATWGQIGTW
jgi:hypothetical protein